MIYDFHDTDNTWLDSCDANEYDPARLLAILAKRWPNVRMVRREAETADVVVDDFGTWLKSI